MKEFITNLSTDRLSRQWFHCMWMGLVILSVYPVSLNAAVIRLEMDPVQYVGGEFRVNIMVQDVDELYGLAMDLNYNPETLEIVDAREDLDGLQPKIMEGPLLNENQTQTTLLGAAVEDGNPGTLVIGLSRSGAADGVTSGAESVFVSVFFRPKGSGTAQLTLARQGLKDNQDQDLPFTIGDQIALTIKEFDWSADVNRSRSISLTDTILVLKAFSNKGADAISIDADVDGDQKIGLGEAIIVLKHISKSANP